MSDTSTENIHLKKTLNRFYNSLRKAGMPESIIEITEDGRQAETEKAWTIARIRDLLTNADKSTLLESIETSLFTNE
jgi:hypothetical protein